MIIPMQKYTFFVYHKEYSTFLKDIQRFGVLHIVENEKNINDAINEKQQLISKYNQTIKLLEAREIEIDSKNNDTKTEGFIIIDKVTERQGKLSSLEQKIETKQRELVSVEPWGDFSVELISKLKEKNYYIRFFTVSKKKFKNSWLSKYNAEVISDKGSTVYFIILQKENKELNIDAEEIKQPKNSASEIRNQIKEAEEKIININNELDNYAKQNILLLKKERGVLLENLEYEKVLLQTVNKVDDKLKVLTGWVPKTKKIQIDTFLEKNSILNIIEKTSSKDKIPVLLKNNKFSKLFEPIGKLFSLPSYAEMDLTVFFAPFFMLFFGFCLGDAGYGLLFIIGAGLYKFKAKPEWKPLLSLVQILGVATVLFGVMTGTIFGINLIETDFILLENYQSMFLNPDNMFNLALALGALQIIFAMFLKAINQTKQFGFTYALATIGWIVAILGSGIYVALTSYELISENTIILYSVLSLGVFLILFFSDVEISIPARIGKGLWDIYTNVTGIFGDLLSYIRLFALGLSSAILGFVVNDIAMQILGSSTIFGPIFFVIFLAFGHGLNIMIASLGSFVHPMRLTFVEFYKNAGFAGGGKEYKPFSSYKENIN